MAARSKRVSMKGRGADIFFGDYEPPAPEGVAESLGEAGDPPAIPASESDAQQASTPRAAIGPPSLPESDRPPGAPSVGDTLDDDAPDQRIDGPDAKQASKQASKRATAQHRKRDDPESEPPRSAPVDPAVLNFIWSNVSEQATLANTFRYTDQDLTWLGDALYEITRRHRVKLTKQDIARLGLNAVLWDYRVHGDASLLGELVKRKQRQR